MSNPFQSSVPKNFTKQISIMSFKNQSTGLQGREIFVSDFIARSLPKNVTRKENEKKKMKKIHTQKKDGNKRYTCEYGDKMKRVLTSVPTLAKPQARCFFLSLFLVVPPNVRN
jgi:hypothetical protein